MRSRAMFGAAVGVGLLVVAGFALLCVGADTADHAVGVYRWRQGLPARVGFDRWALATVGYVAGAALSLLVVALMRDPLRHRRPLTLALLAGIALGLLLTLDGLLYAAPNADLAGVIPSWYAPLSTAQGLFMTALCGLAVIGLPSPPRAGRNGKV